MSQLDVAKLLLEIADEVRSIAATGLHYSESPFDRERYERLMRIAVRLGSLGPGADADALAVAYAADAGYVTPKVDVRLAVFRGDAVLLVRESADGLWALPGGYADVGDSPSEAAARETEEEAGLQVRVTRLVGVYDGRVHPESPPHPFHIFKLLFTGEADPAAEPRPGSETTAADFHPVDALPELSLGRTLPLHIEQALRAARDASVAPHFD